VSWSQRWLDFQGRCLLLSSRTGINELLGTAVEGAFLEKRYCGLCWSSVRSKKSDRDEGAVKDWLCHRQRISDSAIKANTVKAQNGIPSIACRKRRNA
jgi:hypothetical protein